MTTPLRTLVLVLALSAAPVLAAPARDARVPARAPAGPRYEKVVRTPAEWRARLTPEQFHVLREEGTERAFTGALWKEHRKVTFACAGCGLPLFGSDTKFDSGTGWPSFWRPAYDNVVHEVRHVVGHGARRGGLRALRRAPRTRVRGRPRTHGPSLLHQLGVAHVQARTLTSGRLGGRARDALTCGIPHSPRSRPAWSIPSRSRVR